MKQKNKLVYGVGVNDADYEVYRYEKVNGKWKSVWKCPFYRKWQAMLERSYSQELHKKFNTYIDCSTAPEWHYFMTFRAWMVEQDWEGKELDKDLLFPGNKLYSSGTCIFVSPSVNKFLNQNKGNRENWPIGVSFRPENRQFQARCQDILSGKTKSLGYHDTAEEAHQAWLTFKLAQAKILASQQTDLRVAAALIDRYENYGKYFGDK